MKFSILSWNVESFKGSGVQLANVAGYIRSLAPDVFALFEVENVNIVSLISAELPEYDYNLTDGPENKEILVGVRRGKFQQSIFTQKREFKIYNPDLRPGALLSVSLNNEFYSILFLHTDSGSEAPSFGNRTKMFDKIWSLKKALDKQYPNGARFIVLGDLNTMGLQYPTRRKSDIRVTENNEITALEAFAKQKDMTFLAKEYAQTYNNGKVTSNLDHILTTKNLIFRELGQIQGKPFYVKVTGWQQLDGDARKEFIETISDHCSLYCEVL